MSLEMAHKVIVPPKKNYIPLFLKHRDINSYFCIQARNISAQFEERHEAKTVGEMKLFVERLPQMQVSYRIVNFLCSFLRCRLTKDFTFTYRVLYMLSANRWLVTAYDTGCRNSL
jgi:hypothetical protein